MLDLFDADATAIAAAVRAQKTTAETVVTAALAQIDALDGKLNTFTNVLREQALQDAAAVDRAIAAGQDPGPLAGVPFAVKNLLDIAGVVTLAGSKINRDNPPASTDAATVAALRKAGGVLLGGLNMDEYAYGFVTENSHYGATHNPHDLSRVAGGSSGGSAAAVAGGLVPLSLGSDTNGSIRVPAAFCGIFGLKPTYGRVSRAGSALFCASLDHIGPFARSVRDIALSFDLMHGPDPRDPVCSPRPPEPTLPQLGQGIDGLRIAVAESYFATGGQPEVFAAVETVAQALGATKRVILPEAHRARAAAYLITTCEGSNLHLPNLKTRPHDFDPATRDRFLSGALIPASWYLQAQRFRRWYGDRLAELFQHVDLILAPSTPCAAPLIGQETMTIGGQEMLTRPNLGLYTQPLSFIGLPILSVPVQQSGGLPLGVQIIAAPYNESLVLRAGAVLEQAGVVAAPVARV
ncbi:AtzE family amidohydrolase [Thermoleptolyngbya sp. M55_K2018_002]|uniref:AtzE family amidohydrolase n=1 Tax=Thermoleptolyngbya sp. M55_K2018_002 TaxID=2747808 RepID=UPI0019EAEEB0|nr:AtzE family amidohydrolase [Thermoleptolyngbya sp. M55_K2018_002]HIK42651.1 AtzE family amidohydrolase [Thermoleptolyngbya sp. M55_K2018_002]